MKREGVLLYNITARDIFWATEGKRVPDQQLCAAGEGQSTAAQLARYIKLDMLEHTWLTGEIDFQVRMPDISDKYREYLPEILKRLWLDGFDVSFHRVSEKWDRVYRYFIFPVKYKVWILQLTAVSNTPRKEENYVPIKIPKSAFLF